MTERLDTRRRRAAWTGPGAALWAALACVLGGCAATRAATTGEVNARALAGAVEIVAGQGRGEVVIGAVRAPGAVYGMVRDGERLWVARGVVGVTLFDLRDLNAPREVFTFAEGTNAVAVAVEGGWLRILYADGSAVSIDPRRLPIPGGLPRSPMDLAKPEVALSTSPRTPQQESSRLRVTRIHAGEVRLTGPHEPRVGERFLLAGAPPQIADEGEGLGATIRGVVEVERVVDGAGVATLPRGVIPALGDVAIATPTPPRDLLRWPRQWRPLTRVQLLIRPAITVHPTGFAMLTEASVDHYFQRPVRIGVALAPAGFAAQSNPSALDGSLASHGGFGRIMATAGVYTNYFEAGVSLGADLHSRQPHSAAVGASLRGGNLDGFHITLATTLIFPRGAVTFGGVTADIDIPVRRRYTLNGHVGGSLNWIDASLGLKTWLRGSGGPGTVILLAGFGLVSITELDSGFGVGVHGLGPAVTVGLEWRP